MKALILLLLLTSCSMKINLTPVQKRDVEVHKFNRFRPRQDESRVAQIIGFAGIGLGLYYNNNLRTNK